MTWYAYQSKPRESALARRNLAEQGLTAYVPDLGDEPFGYGFLDCERVPWECNSTPGVLRLLPFADRPQAIPDDAIAVVREVERSLAEVVAKMQQDDGPEPLVAGMARTMVANLLRSVGIAVTVKSRVEMSHAAPPRAARLKRSPRKRFAHGEVRTP